MGNYLVTGGAGFIGSHLCDALLAKGDTVTIVDDLSSGNLRNIASLPQSARFIQADVRSVSPDGLTALDGVAFDGVIHLAALISGYDSLYDPDAYVRSNIDGLLRVIAFVAKKRIPRIVFASSSTVFGNNDEPSLDEQRLPAPISVYASTKLSGEHLLAMYGAMHGFSHCSLRFFNVYGPRQAVDHPYANVTCKFSNAAAKGLAIKLYGDGTQSRDFVYVDDVVQSLLLVLDDSPSTLYNIGTGAQTSINDLISTLEGIAGRKFEIERLTEWPNDIKRISADINRAKAELDFTPDISIGEGLRRTVEFFRDEQAR